MRVQISHLALTTRLPIAVVAAALLMIAASAPAARATSPVSQAAAPHEKTHDGSSISPLTRDEIQFLEENWNFNTGALLRSEDELVGRSAAPRLTREEIEFMEANWHFNSGELMTEATR